MIQEQLKKEMKEREEKTLTEIANLPLEEGFVPVEGLPIPFRNEVLLLPIMQGEKKTASGIIMPAFTDKANDKKLAIVAAIGPNVTLPIRVGLRVLFDNRGNYFRINAQDGNEYLMTIENFIYAAATPETYIVPEFRSKLEKRNDARKEGFDNKMKDDKITTDIITGKGGEA